MRHHPLHTQRGVTAVEMAFTLVLLVTLLLGTIDTARWVLAIASAAEATRDGARVAVVCDVGDTVVQQRTLARLVGTDPAVPPTVVVAGVPAGCSAAATTSGTTNVCKGVTVSLSGAQLQPLAPFMPLSLPLPASLTYLPREAMLSTVQGRANPICN